MLPELETMNLNLDTFVGNTSKENRHDSKQ